MKIHLAAAVVASALTVGAAAGPSAAGKPYRMVLVTKNLPGAVQLTTPPGGDGRLYVVQRRGLVRMLAGGRVFPEPFLDLRGRVSFDGERGLLSIAFHPQYASNRRVYVFYTEQPGGEINIVEYRTEGFRVVPASARTLVRVPHPDSPYHNGGALAFGPGGRLYAGIGDGGYRLDQPRAQPDPHGNSQNLDVLLAKVFALDVDAPDARPEIVAYGLRNPWRFAFDPASGDLVIGEVGWNRTEEIDVVPRAGPRPLNFGWSIYEGRRRRETDVTLNPAGPLTWPILTYGHGAQNCSVTGGLVYQGSIRRLRGRYVYGDYCSGRIWSVVLRSGRAVGLRLEPFRVRGLTSFGADGRGELYAVTLTGRVYRFRRA